MEILVLSKYADIMSLRRWIVHDGDLAWHGIWLVNELYQPAWGTKEGTEEMLVLGAVRNSARSGLGQSRRTRAVYSKPCQACNLNVTWKKGKRLTGTPWRHGFGGRYASGASTRQTPQSKRG